MQKIEIKYLGPVQELEMDIKDFNLLIGEQATGKSTVAKAIYFFRIIKSTLTDYLCQVYDTALYNGNDVSDGFNKVLKKELKSIFISLFGYSWDLDKRLYLKYEYASGIWIDVKLNKNGKRKYISVRYSPKLTQTLKDLEKEALELFEQKPETTIISLAYASKERLRNYDNFKNSVNKIFDDYKETYYIPAGRSMLTLLVNNRSLLENDNLDLITRQFMQVIDNIHRVFEDGIRNVHKRYPDGERRFDVTKTAEMLISDLKGDYLYNAGKEYIVVEDEGEHSEKIPINFASSGQQEVLWLLNQLYILMLKKEKAFVIIEEPEAHLYPSLQSKVVEFISYFANINNSSILITTHSPYILTSVNTLYCAGKVIEKNSTYSKKVYDIIDSNCEIDPQKVTALKINKDKSILNLINEELQELNTEMIDEISDSVNEKYMELYYLLMSENDVL
ncbi:AAA family ATPase [Blautia sp. MSJ-36]|uniref:AAA family ATPase n=1 Tax=Blautia sp. MSJ-36 TaxID=2841530 RepID=UPI001C100E5A|nr:AAA family ATPase [Blautia sp. MSJ-36]MBU5448505.1 ATP-binding protein [Blautia sp. MSJ-36]